VTPVRDAVRVSNKRPLNPVVIDPKIELADSGE